jgi:hypothetical protein
MAVISPPISRAAQEGILLRTCPDRWAEWASEGRFRPYAYQRDIAQRIARAIQRGNGRLIVNVPSRHGKSELCSHWLPAWYLDSYPARGVILASYGAELAEHWGREVRNEFEQNPRLFTRLREDSTAANRWNTPKGGGMVAVGVGGPVVGFGGNLIVVDDPHKNEEEAGSPLYRDKVVNWFRSTLYSRIEPNGTVVVLMQRWHPDDLSGWLIEKHSDPWQVIRLPAVAEVGDPLGRQAGDPLCPERYDAAALDRIRAAVSPAAWAAMYQQRPEGAGTGRLYHQFTQADNVDKTLALRPDLPLQVSFDFNRNPGMHVEVGQYDARADLFTAVHEIHGPYMKLGPSLEALGRLVADLGGFRWPHLEVYGDATGTQERAETTLTCYQAVVKYLNGTGWPYHLRVPKSNPPVRDRVETFNAALHDAGGEVHYKAHPRCERLLADLREMKEDEQGLEDKRDQKLSHASSAEGYRIHWIRPLHKPKPARMYGGSTVEERK